MTTVIRRRRGLVQRAVGLFAVFGLVLGACSSGPSQVNAAAIVGGTTISVDRVQQLVEEAVKVEPAAQALADQRKLDLLSRAVLRQLVLHELIAVYARDNNVIVDPGQVGQLAGQLTSSLQPLPTDGSVTADVIVDQAVNRVFDPAVLAKDYLTLAKIGREAAPGLSVTFDYVVIAPGSPEEPTGSLRGQAEEMARKLASNPAEARKVIESQIAAEQQADLDETFTPAAVADIAGTVIFGTPEGNVIGFQPNPEQAAWVVAVITKRETDAKPDPQNPQDPAAADDPRMATALGPRILQQTATEVGVKISPRYGVWDIAAMGVAPSEQETVGFVLPMAGGATQP
ncbi:SurA N-terminal domain-containing protein [Actinokineospora sp. 24-640]